MKLCLRWVFAVVVPVVVVSVSNADDSPPIAGMAVQRMELGLDRCVGGRCTAYAIDVNGAMVPRSGKVEFPESQLTEFNDFLNTAKLFRETGEKTYMLNFPISNTVTDFDTLRTRNTSLLCERRDRRLNGLSARSARGEQFRLNCDGVAIDRDLQLFSTATYQTKVSCNAEGQCYLESKLYKKKRTLTTRSASFPAARKAEFESLLHWLSGPLRLADSNGFDPEAFLSIHKRAACAEQAAYHSRIANERNRFETGFFGRCDTGANPSSAQQRPSAGSANSSGSN